MIQLIVAAQIVETMRYAEERRAWLDSMPKVEADKIRASDSERARQDDLHRRALEVAEAGRARNFWGN